MAEQPDDLAPDADEPGDETLDDDLEQQASAAPDLPDEDDQPDPEVKE